MRRLGRTTIYQKKVCELTKIKENLAETKNI